MSLDVFRGATIAGMMLVNNPGDWSAVYPQLEHAEWNGWTFTDLIFPFFLCIVGVAVPLSMARRLEQGQPRGQLFRHALQRAALIFALGFSLNAFNYFIDGSIFHLGLAGWCHNFATNVRIPGVLQRIAVCYLAATTIYLLGGLRGALTAIALLLSGYWLVMMLVPVPGCGAGSLTKDCNFSQFLDNLVLNGPHIGTHVWKTAKTWDPEGIFSTLPAIATCLFGILAGQLLRSPTTPATKTSWLFTAGSVLVLLGQILSTWMPINKSLWTSTYSIFMAGMALLCFAVCYWLIDVQGWRRWVQPFAIYGMNAITVFMLAGITGRLSLEIKVANASGQPVALKTWLYDHLFSWLASADTAGPFGFLASPRNASLAWALMYVLGLYLVAHLMYRRKWFLRC
jgi:predicted acyltransferase